LSKSIAQDYARECGVDAVIDLPPVANADPHQHGPAQQERATLGLEIEIVLEGEAGAGPIGQQKREREKENIRRGKQYPGFASMASKHSDSGYL
jgi:hypothetical protein